MIGPRSMATLLKPRYPLVEIGACEFMVEVKCHVRHVFQRVQKTLIQACTVYRTDKLRNGSGLVDHRVNIAPYSVVDIVLLRFLIEVTSLPPSMNHAAMHRNRLRKNSVY